MDRPGPTDRFAWVLAGLPLLAIALFVLDAKGVTVSNSVISAFGVGAAIGLATVDVKSLDGAGVSMSRVWGPFLAAFVPPAYLIVRAVKLRRGSVIAVAWFVCVALAVGGFVAVGTALGVRVDTASIEREISADFTARAGQTIEVACPSGVTVKVHESFHCTASTAPGETEIVDVRVENMWGGFSYALVLNG